jgi:predicted nucleic acid-binding protein
VIAYIDTSVLLRIVLGEPKQLREWKKLDSVLSSELIRVEALRSIDRARVLLQLDEAELAERRAGVLQLLAGFRLARVDSRVLARAGDPFPTLIHTLDAIHLATAELARRAIKDLVFATHDRELGTAATALGFRVIGLA